MIEELKRFIAVAKNKHITKTAQELFITQSTLSQSIQRLEKELRTRLVIYKAKQLTITPEGEMVILIGIKIVELWEKLHDQKTRISNQRMCSVGMFDNAALLLGDFFQNNEYVENTNITLTIESSTQLITKLQLGIVDIALCVFDLQKMNVGYRDILCVAEFTEELFPVSAKIFSLPLSNIPFILYNKESHTRKQIEAIFTEKGVVPFVLVDSTSTTYMKELAKLGSGVAFLPRNFISEEIKQKQLFMQDIQIKVYRKYGLFLRTSATKQEKDLARAIGGQLHKKLAF